MMWLLFAVLLVFASRADCGALRCTEGSSCTEESQAPSAENSRNDLQDDSWRLPECLAGSEWESNCHSCKCSDAGRAVCVKQEKCEKGVSAEPMRCKPNTRFQMDCNWCDCWEGEAMCTRMECYEEPRLSKRSTELLEGDDCAPGSTWKSECNTCECDAKGKPVCTQNACDGEVTEPKRTCAPNTSWRFECNTCWCDKGGDAACTRKGCIGFNNFPILRSSRVERSVSLPSGNDCAPGSTWKSACNTCFCTPNGNAACTRKECYGESFEPERSCAPRTSWKDDCNTCTCNDNGLAMCTLKGCLGTRAKRSVSLPTGKHCAAGSTWKSECNTCICTQSGEATCTRKECYGESNNEPRRTCAPKTSWKDDCNTCFCSESGYAMCTLMECYSPKDFQIEKLQRAERSVSLPTGKQCAAGSTWKSECNTCTCNEGGEAECTRRECNGELPEPKRFCAPETSWMNDCNHCWCSDSGHGMCTLMGCFHPGDFQNAKLRRAERSVPSGGECAPGSTWKSECNTCSCTDNGEVECTRQKCGEDVSEPKRTCAPGTSWKNDCNSCFCSETGFGYCTLMGCFHGELFPIKVENEKVEVPKPVTQTAVSRKKRAFQEPPKQCQPGQEFRMDCNKCLCDNEGQNFSCTRIDCNALNNNHNDAFASARKKRDTTTVQEVVKCVPGSVFDRGCNVCRCSEDGHHAVCTMKRCRHDNELDSRATGRARPRF